MMLNKQQYLIKERFSLLKITDRYEIIDPETSEVVAYARENISMTVKGLRLVINKKLLPTTIEIKNKEDQLLYFMKRPTTLLRAKVLLHGKNGDALGYFKSRILTVGGRFDVFNMKDQLVASVKGSWTGWHFTMMDEQGNRLGEVTKKWAGIGKELFTSSDNYMVSMDERVSGKPEITALLLMAGLAVDMIYKENS